MGSFPRMFCIGLLVLSLCVPYHCASAETVLRVRADDWMPMNGQPNSPYPGFLVEILKAVFEPEGIKVDYRLLPWERAMQETRAGRIDCVIGAYKSDVPDFVFPELHWGVDHAVLFVRASERWTFNGDLQQLKQRRTGVVTGYSYGDEFDAFGLAHQGQHIFYISGKDPLKMNIKKLKAGRLNTILDGVAPVMWQLKQLGAENYLKIAGEVLPPEPIYLACSPAKFSSQRIVNLADKGFLRIRASGELQSILDRYDIPMWQ